MRILPRSLAFLLVSALLAVGSSPCPQSAQDVLLEAERVTPGALLRPEGHSTHSGHGDEMRAKSVEELGHDQAAHQAKLHAYCTCGCSNDIEKQVPGYRLGVMLLDMPQASIEIHLENAILEQAVFLPTPPVIALEHIPLTA